MLKGRAPLVSDAQRLGNRATYELHHLGPIGQGGSVYDMGNIIVATPLFHVGIFHR
jgi:hypothetical protein